MKKGNIDMNDYLTQQIVSISKSGAYDAIKDNYEELQEQNKVLKAAINKALDEIQNAAPSMIVDNPAYILRVIADHLLNALKETK